MKKDLTQGKEWKAILFFALPLMLGMFIQQLYNVVDGIVIGLVLGEDALSAVGVSLPLVLLCLALAMGLSAGSGIIISQNFGAKRMEDMPKTVSTVMLLAGSLGLVTTTLAIAFTPLFFRHVVQVPDYIFPMAVLYFRIFSIGIFFQFLYNGVASFLLSIGNAKVTLYFLIASAVLNVFLTILFVVILRLGVAGAAVTTVIAKLVAAVIAYVYMVKKYPYLRPAKSFDKKICRLAVKLSFPLALQQSIVSLGFMAMGRLINSFGVISIAGYTVAMRVEGLAIIPLFAFSNSITTFTGQNVGAGRLDRVKSGLWSAELMTTVCGLFLIIILMPLAGPISALFGLEGAALARSVAQIRFLAPWFVVLSLGLVTGGMLKGAGDVRYPAIITALNLALRVGLAYWLVHIGRLGYNAAWATTPVGWVLMLVALLYRVYRGKWKDKAVVKREA